MEKRKSIWNASPTCFSLHDEFLSFTQQLFQKYSAFVNVFIWGWDIYLPVPSTKCSRWTDFDTNEKWLPVLPEKTHIKYRFWFVVEKKTSTHRHNGDLISIIKTLFFPPWHRRYGTSTDNAKQQCLSPPFSMVDVDFTIPVAFIFCDLSGIFFFSRRTALSVKNRVSMLPSILSIFSPGLITPSIGALQCWLAQLWPTGPWKVRIFESNILMNGIIYKI